VHGCSSLGLSGNGAPGRGSGWALRIRWRGSRGRPRREGARGSRGGPPDDRSRRGCGGGDARASYVFTTNVIESHLRERAGHPPLPRDGHRERRDQRPAHGTSSARRGSGKAEAPTTIAGRRGFGGTRRRLSTEVPPRRPVGIGSARQRIGREPRRTRSRSTLVV
jgi:hypothetical protein